MIHCLPASSLSVLPLRIATEPYFFIASGLMTLTNNPISLNRESSSKWYAPVASITIRTSPSMDWIQDINAEISGSVCYISHGVATNSPYGLRMQTVLLPFNTSMPMLIMLNTPKYIFCNCTPSALIAIQFGSLHESPFGFQPA